MISVIKDTCNKLSDNIDNRLSPDNLITECAYNRICSLYEKESQSLDTAIDDIVKGLDTENITTFTIIIKKLNKMLNNNREHLLIVLERLVSING